MTTRTRLRHSKKERLYRLFAMPASALSNPHRLELVDLLSQAPRTVEELAVEADMSVANTSQHLQRLKHARLVAFDREGQFIRYRLADRSVARLWLDLRGVGRSRMPEVEQALDAYRDRRHELETISKADLRRLQRRREVALIDARPAAEYAAGHLPGAISLPPDEVEERLDTLPRDKMIVAYCRGPYCVYADDVLALLAGRGFRVARLEEGVLEWDEGE